MTWTNPNDSRPIGPRPGDPADPVGEAEAVAYDALCLCCDTFGDNPFCPVCVYVDDKYGSGPA